MSKAALIENLEDALDEAHAFPDDGWPEAVNCAAGTVPVWTYFLDSEFHRSMHLMHARMQSHLRDGWIPVIGTSIEQAMDVTQIHPACVNMGIAGDTTRGVLWRIKQPPLDGTGFTQSTWEAAPVFPAFTRAGAVILEPSTNDAGSEAIANQEITLDRLFAFFTGPLVVVSCIPHTTPATIDAVNGLLAARCSGRANTVFVNITTALRGSNNYLNPAYGIGDPVHLNAAGYGVVIPLIRAGLESVL